MTELLDSNSIKIGNKIYHFNDITCLFDGYNYKRFEYIGGYYREQYSLYNISLSFFKKYKKLFDELDLNERYFDFLNRNNGKFKRDDFLDYSKKDLEDSINRSKCNIRDIIYLNKFDYFVTITFDPKLIDSSDPRVVLEKFNKKLQNFTQRKKLKYIMVPELHKNSRIHFHGLLSGDLTFVDSGTRIVDGFEKPLKLSKIKRLKLFDQIKHVVYNILDFDYGFTTAVELKEDHKLGLVNYINKYISKDLDTKIFGKRFWSSKNLIREVSVYIDTVSSDAYDNIKSLTYKGFNNEFKYRSNLNKNTLI